MYTRSYTEENSGILIPESYGGTALRDSGFSESEDVEEKMSEYQEPIQRESTPPREDSDSVHTSGVPKSEGDSVLGSLFSKLPIGNIFGNIFGNGKFSLQNIGIEEILILATAAFLFFSKEGDKECAIMLMLLLFIA